MIINKLKINGFGNLENKDISFNNGINLIVGGNENGKSTLLKFIQTMLFGFSKSRAGKNLTDEEKFKPWYSNYFSGKIDYTLDNNQGYSIYRDFYAKDFQVLNENGENITSLYGIDKQKGSLCFYEQTHVDEEMLLSTTVVEQGKSRLDNKSQNTIIQKITNLLSTGNDSISYQKTVDNLNKKLIDDVGTDRTSGRPINLINEKINTLRNEKQILSTSLNEESIKKETVYLNQKLDDEYKKLELLNKLKVHIEKSKIIEEKINLNSSILEENTTQLDNLNNSYNNFLNTKNNNINKTNSLLFFIIICVIVAIFNFFIYAPLSIILSILLFLSYICFYTIKIFKLKKFRKIDLQRLNLQKKEIEKNIKILNDNIKESKNNLLDDKQKLIMSLQSEYFSIINSNDLKNIFDASYAEILDKIVTIEKIINETKFRIHTVNIEKEDLDNKKLKLNSCNINLENALNEKQNLINLQESILIAKDALEIAYKKAKENIIPNIQDDLNYCISTISNGKYKKTFFNENGGLFVELNNGKSIPVELLSTGTIDQMYLALRLIILSKFSNEKIPIILDESFAFYDKSHLENMLKYLSTRFHDFQIIILSCSNRELDCLKNLNINYNLISI